MLNVGVASYYPLGIEDGGLRKQYVRFVYLTESVLLGFAPFLFVVFVFDFAVGEAGKNPYPRYTMANF